MANVGKNVKTVQKGKTVDKKFKAEHIVYAVLGVIIVAIVVIVVVIFATMPSTGSGTGTGVTLPCCQ